MAHWDYIKPGGTWSLLSLLTSSIMAEIDRRLYRCIHEEGGTWSPAAQIILGGQGLRVDGPFRAWDATIAISSGKTLTLMPGAIANFRAGSTLNMIGAAALTGTLAVSGAGYITIDNLAGLRITSTGSAVVDSGGYVTVNGSLDINGQLTMASGATASLAGTCAFTGSSTFSGYANFTGYGTTGGARFFGETTFREDSATLVAGTAGHPAGWIFGRNTAITVNGVFGNPSAWTIGPYATFTDSGVWARTGTETWGTAGNVVMGGGSTFTANSGATVRTLAGSMTRLEGGLVLAHAVQPSKNQDPGEGAVWSTAIPKAFGTITTNGSGGATLADGLNVADVTVGVNSIIVTFARPMANDDYAIALTTRGLAAYSAQVISQSANGFQIGLYNATATIAPNIDPNVSVATFFFTVMGRQ